MTRRRLRAFACVVGLAVLAAACDAATGGDRVSFRLAVEVTHGSGAPFRTSAGWVVTLEEACVALGPVHFFELPIGLARGGPRRQTLPARLVDVLVPSAHAHPGVDHFAGGEVRGEWLEQVVVDAGRAPARVPLGSAPGIAGEVRSVTVGIHPPAGAALGRAACLRGHQAFVVGVARRGAEVVAFEGGLDIPPEGTKRRLQIAADLELDDASEVVLTVDPRVWLDHAKWETLPAPGPGARASLAEGTQPHAAWSLGIQTAGALVVRSARAGADASR